MCYTIPMNEFANLTSIFLVCLCVIVGFEVVHAAVSLLLTAYRARLAERLAAEWFRRWKEDDVVREHILEVLEDGEPPPE